MTDNLHDDAPMSDSIARVTPLGLEPITAPDQMAHITGEINRRLSERNQAQRAEIDRWAQAFERVFEENERNQKRVEELEEQVEGLNRWLEDRGKTLRESWKDNRFLITALKRTRQTLSNITVSTLTGEMYTIGMNELTNIDKVLDVADGVKTVETPLGEQIDGGGELPE